MNILKRIKAWRNPPEQKLIALQPELKRLVADLERVQQLAKSDPLSAITPFFGVTSPWHDRGLRDVIDAFARVNDGQYNTIIGKLATIESQFAAAGRDTCGWNRTKEDEQVTPDKVYLGGVYGLFTHPVPFWQERKDSENEQSRDACAVIAEVAGRFIENHAQIMTTRARELLAA